ncbi:MAG: DarT ssDNA thymidine ADP-ribosyltransferase family protein [Cetobacterium sp.]
MHHITHIENLESILENGIHSRNEVKKFVNTADNGIIKGRESVNGCNLNNYVPLHFNYFEERHGIGYNYVVIQKYNKENMIYLIPEIENHKERMIYSLYHPTSSFGKIIENSEEFFDKIEKVYISLLGIEERLDYSNNEVKQFLKSEALVYSNIKVEEIKSIYVYNQNVKTKVEGILKNKNIKNINVIIKPKFFPG